MLLPRGPFNACKGISYNKHPCQRISWFWKENLTALVPSDGIFIGTCSKWLCSVREYSVSCSVLARGVSLAENSTEHPTKYSITGHSRLLQVATEYSTTGHQIGSRGIVPL